MNRKNVGKYLVSNVLLFICCICICALQIVKRYPKRTSMYLDLNEVLHVEHVNCIINNDNVADGHWPFRILASAHILRNVSKDPVCVHLWVMVGTCRTKILWWSGNWCFAKIIVSLASWYRPFGKWPKNNPWKCALSEWSFITFRLKYVKAFTLFFHVVWQKLTITL